MSYLFTSESVGEGHPDKLCDQLSDTLLDAYLEKDPDSKVAIECFVKTGFLVIGGEVTSKEDIDIQALARKKICDIGYTSSEYGFDGQTCGILVSISKQSPDIAQGVEKADQGAGDQGLMFGYATNETDSFMPLPITLAHALVQQVSHLRKAHTLEYLRPDCKSQVTVQYENGKPERVHTVVLSVQHDPLVTLEKLKEDIRKKVIEPICGKWLDDKTIYHINPTGRFVIGGPVADTGLTGRKIIVDTYGGFSRHGGGCFSGKDSSKVDRSAAYAARYIAKNVVAANLAERCEVQLAYAIGVADPVSVYIDCFGTNRVPLPLLVEAVKKTFPLKPKEIITQLRLKKPIYAETAVNGHFGHDPHNDSFTWEKLDKVSILQESLAPRPIKNSYFGTK